MARTDDVVAYILDAVPDMTTMKFQKLCYYSQAWTLATTNEPLFDDKFQPYDQGPVIGWLFYRFKGLRYVQRQRFLEGDASSLSDSERHLIDRVIAQYGPLSGDELSSLTHVEAPWLNARKRGYGYLSEDDMRDTYQNPEHKLQGLTALEIAFGAQADAPKAYDRAEFAKSITSGPSAAVAV